MVSRQKGVCPPSGGAGVEDPAGDRQQVDAAVNASGPTGRYAQLHVSVILEASSHYKTSIN